MPNNHNTSKVLFFVVVVGAVAVSGMLRPSLFVSGDDVPNNVASGTAGAVGTAGTAANRTPIFVLPSLSASIGSQGQTVDAPGSGTMNASTTSQSPFARVGTAAAPAIGASAALVADLTTGASFLHVNANGRWPLASVSKLMTAAVAEDVLGQSQRITITESMLAADPTQQILHLGDTYTVADLLHILLLPSNNVAAEALVQFYGRTRFLAAMNAKAQQWGMAGTYYDDPSGLSAANESSANDLLKLAQHMYVEYPQVLAITRMPQATVENLSGGGAVGAAGAGGGSSVTIKSINNFAGTADFIGGKTGYTDQADGNLLSIFSYENRPILIVILGVNDGVRFNATQQLFTWFKTNFR